MDKAGVLKLFKDVRFWIFLFLLLRLFGITDAPLEMGHNWRQSLTNMIARNFLEVSPNIFYPRIDMAGDLTGILGSEFPFFSYLIFIIAKIFGYDHWYGRLINLLISSVSMYYFYLLVKKYFNERISFNATLILIVSIWFSFSRKIMPDTFSVSLVIIGLYYSLQYFEKGRFYHLLLFFGLITLGVLCKIPALALVSLLAIPLLVQFPMRRKINVFIAGTISVSIASAWYFYWVPYLVDTYHFKLYFPKGLIEGFNEIIQYPFDTLDKFWFTSFYSFIAFAVFLAGLVLMFIRKNRLLIGLFVLVSAVFFVFILKTGSVFSLHNYYIIPYTPVMAIIAGYALSLLDIKWQTILIILISVESLANQSNDFIIKESELYKLELEKAVSDKINQNDLIIVNGGLSPQTIYFLHRKGWSVDNEKIIQPGFIENKTGRGARYLIIDKHIYGNTLSLPVLYSDDNIDVYVLKPSLN
jgi:4-amino-4-deoxy-L-arabinose transferase-like glycosyltransferase